MRIWHRLDIPFPRVEWLVGGKIDLIHATDFVLAPSQARRKVVTVHDLAFLHYPEAAMPSLHHYLNTVVPRSVRRADHLLADSHHTAKDLQERWQIPAQITAASTPSPPRTNSPGCVANMASAKILSSLG